ncbi:MAG: cytochrome c [Planctomycetes bacterium]|nr:cytochrome c [Planctomycetota bacterium]
MKLLNQAGWRTPPEHPDIDPANESKILAEYFKALCDDPKIKSRSEEFRQMLNGSLKLAEDLRQSISGRTADAKNAEFYFDRLKQSCKSCHAQYRN